MGAHDVLDRLAAAGLTVRADNDRLFVRPADRLNDNILAALRAAKPELLALLAGDRTLPATSAPATDRTCAGCAHLTRRKTCAEPIAAGLADHFSILWPEPGRATRCPAFDPKPAAPTPDRPHKLTPAEADAAHAEPWDEGACARFAARVGQLLRLGIAATDADDLAERAHLLDVQAEGRAMCVQCVNLAGHVSAGWRCRSNRAAGIAAELPAALVTTMQRCPAFSEAAP